jgi:hypothetical protein
MRKLLLSTTALIAAGAISSAAVADGPSVTGSYKFSYQDYDSGITTTGESGDRMWSESAINFKFSEKTESGLTMAYGLAIVSESDDNAGDSLYASNHHLTLTDDWGTLQLGAAGGVGDKMTRTAHDILGTPDGLHGDLNAFHNTAGTGNLADDNADLGKDIDDQSNITYILPKMGGLTAGVTIRDAGENTNQNDDETEVGAKYAFTSGNLSGTLHYGANSQDGTTAGATGLDSSSMGIDVTMGSIRAVYAQSQTDVTATVETEITDFGVKYDFGNGMTLAGVQTSVEENTGGETLDVTTVGASYTIASGLTASLTYHDYDYENGTSNETDDDGSATIFSIVAKF